MKYFKQSCSDEHKQLKQMMYQKQRFEETKQRIKYIHSHLHCGSVYGAGINEVDNLFIDMSKEEYSIMPHANDETIAWCIWHMARCEDLTMNLLVKKGNQVLNDEWLKRMNVTIRDTANAMNDDEILQFSHEVGSVELLAYRDAVGMSTKGIIENLEYEDLKRLIDLEDVRRIHTEGGVIDHPDSIWLLEYWGSKDVAKLFLMPATRHLILHLNDIASIKQSIRKKTW